MSRTSKWFALASVVFLAVLAISPLKDHFQEWRVVRRKYSRLLQEMAPRVGKRPVQVQQIWLPDAGKTDRCPTCHAGMIEPPAVQKVLATAGEPFQPHPPGIPHSFAEMGCTYCHRGQGPATTKKDAHGGDPHWSEPLLPPDYIEAGCGTCHREPRVEGAPVLTRGRALIEEAKCLNCHETAGMAKPERTAPDLDGIGTKVVRGWLERWLRDPAATLPNARMPDFHLSDDEVEGLTAYLLSLRTDSLAPVPDLVPDPDRGGTRFREARCISCHTVNGKGGPLAADLGQIAGKTNRQWLYNFVKDPHRFQPDTPMPHYGLSEQDAVDIVDYMLYEFIDPAVYETDEAWAPAESPETYVLTPTKVREGREVYRKYGCAACHRIQGEDETPVVVAPELTGVGSKPVDELDFGATDIPRTIHDWLYQKVSDPRSFETGNVELKMPTFRFTDEDTRAVVTALLSLTKDPVPANLRPVVADPPQYDPQGAAGRLFDRYRCLSCHVVYGHGGTLADADLTHEGSKVEEKWLAQYLKTPFAIRPILEERMPRLELSDQQAQFLARYMADVYVDDSIPGDVFGGAAPAKTLVARGRDLFFHEYGCQACHIIEGQGGYIGPSLDNAPGRLKSGWVFQWLKGPQRLKPDSREPNFGMSDEDATAIAAYVLYGTAARSGGGR